MEANQSVLGHLQLVGARRSLADPGPILQIPERALLFFWFTFSNHRILESLRLEKPLR